MQLKDTGILPTRKRGVAAKVFLLNWQTLFNQFIQRRPANKENWWKHTGKK